MPAFQYAFSQPKLAVLRWLTHPGRSVSAKTRSVLLAELFTSQKSVVAVVLNGLVFNVVAIALGCGRIFAVFILVDVALYAGRMVLNRRATLTAERNLPTPTDLFLVTSMSWAALQGAMAFCAMQSGLMPLELFSATTVMGLCGLISARNYAAPRFAFALVTLCELPLVAGAVLSGDHRLLIMALQMPLYLFGIGKVISRFQTLAVMNLEAEQASYDRARHDVLTGLLNRFGLMEMLDRQYATVTKRFILFYLDLDGFKLVNDTFGHHAGDRVLQAVASRLGSVVRQGDVVARLGGDEFVIVAPEMLPSDGSACALSVIRRIADEPYVIEGIGPLRIGVSVGFACAPEDGRPGDDLHRKADAALYEAKAAGKGVHRRFTPSPGPAVSDAAVIKLADHARPLTAALRR